MILAYNTSLSDLHIELFSDSAEQLAEFHYSPTEKDRGIHDALLAQKTSDLFQEISASPKDISTITFINGPGSFTGLRIGLAFAKGFAMGQMLSTKGISLVPLLAHKVLFEQYTEQHTLSKNIVILYPGYAKDSVYISFANDPENIRYVKILELEKMSIQEVICPPEVNISEMTCHAMPISLKKMAEITLTTGQQSRTSYADLEPFYGTDFKPTM